MSSTILYKFRASSTFEALPLPGSAARLFDVKKAIVKANKLDAGSMEFDLSVRNADTNEEYVNESMLLPRGTRIIVQRLPAARGHGFLARMARNEHAGGAMAPPGGAGGSHNQSGYYTIDSRTRDDEEFVSSTGPAGGGNNDEKELESLQAAIAMQPDGPTMTGGAIGGHRRGGPPPPAGMGGPPGGGPKPNFHKPPPSFSRPNADPELREQEKKLQPKKRATGIPRTFLNLSAPPQTEANKDGETEQTPLLQPNKIGFEELVSRGGGQSESAARAKSLDYALKITSTTVPEHLQCAICHGIVKNAMLLPWDTEGRTVCDVCIRDALTQNGFRCPLTGMDGVSPDDLIPNVGLRKAAEMFINSVMEKVDEIEKQQVEDSAAEVDETNAQTSESNILEGEGIEKGVIVSKRTSLSSRKKDDGDPFGGGDIFGGDVFAVEVKKDEKVEEEEDPVSSKIQKETSETSNTAENGSGPPGAAESVDDSSNQPKDVSDALPTDETGSAKDQPAVDVSSKDRSNSMDASATDDKSSSDNNPVSSEQPQAVAPAPAFRRRGFRRRGPPTGYAAGPGGGAVVSARVSQQPRNSRDFNHGGDGRGHSQSPRGRGGGGGKHHDSHQDHGGRSDDHQGNDYNNRGKKRRRDDRHNEDGPSGPSPRGQPGRGSFDDRGRGFGRGGRGPPPFDDGGRGFGRGQSGAGGRFQGDFGGRFGGRGGRGPPPGHGGRGSSHFDDGGRGGRGGRGVRGRDGGRGRGRGGRRGRR